MNQQSARSRQKSVRRLTVVWRRRTRTEKLELRKKLSSKFIKNRRFTRCHYGRQQLFTEETDKRV